MLVNLWRISISCVDCASFTPVKNLCDRNYLQSLLRNLWFLVPEKVLTLRRSSTSRSSKVSASSRDSSLTIVISASILEEDSRVSIICNHLPSSKYRPVKLLLELGELAAKHLLLLLRLVLTSSSSNLATHVFGLKSLADSRRQASTVPHKTFLALAPGEDPDVNFVS